VKEIESDRIELARNFIRTALKVKKLLQIYPSNNIVYQNALEEIFSMAKKYLATYGDLVIVVTPSELLVESEQIFQSAGGALARMDNLALLFFKEGIKELVFKEGLLKRDLEEFLKLIGIDFDRDETGPDFISALWEKGFESIKYTINEIAYLEDDESAEALVAGLAGGHGGGKGEAEVGATGGASDTGMQLLASASALESGEGETGDIYWSDHKKEGRLRAAYTDSVNAEDAAPPATAALTAEERAFILAGTSDDQPSETGRLADILLRMLASCRDKAEADSIVKSLEGLITYALRGNDILSILATLRGVSAPLKGDADTGDKTGAGAYSDKVAAFCSSPAAMKQLERILDSTKQISEEDLMQFAQMLGPQAVMPFIDLLDRLQTISARRMVNNVLIRIGESNLKALAESLRSPTWYLVRNIVYVLRNIGNPAVVDDIIAAARHEHPRVRLEVVKALRRFMVVRSIQALTEFLDDPDSTVRLSAIAAMGNVDKDTGIGIIVKDAIMARIKGGGFAERDFREKKSLCEALTPLADGETDKYMLKVLGKKSLFAGKKAGESRACAAYYMGLTGNRESLPTLEKLSSVSDQLLREHAAAAVQRIRRG